MGHGLKCTRKSRAIGELLRLLNHTHTSTHFGYSGLYKGKGKGRVSKTRPSAGQKVQTLPAGLAAYRVTAQV